jgi:hypothetical protein
MDTLLRFPISRETLMRMAALAILAIVVGLTAAPARAQTYGPGYPVCLQVYDIDGGYIECSYSSLAQCNQSASGRAAQCIVNPFFPSAQASVGPHDRRHRRVH